MFWTFCFYRLERRFVALEYRTRHFQAYIAWEKKVGKMGIFGPKLWDFWKNVIFSTFWTSCFYRLERRFFALEYRTHIPSNMCSPTFETDIHHIFAPLPEKHLLLVICVPLPGKHIFLVKCVPLSGKHICLVICVFLPGKHISLVIFSPTWETHIPCDMRFLTR